MSRKFGIEIEFGSNGGRGDLQRYARALAREGLGDGTVYPYNRNAPAPYWTIKSDGSVQGGELVSPVLNIDNPDDREQVSRAIRCIKAAGAYTDSSAGIHVHIDGAGLDVKQLSAVAKFFVKFEDCIYRVASSGWPEIRGGAHSYARPLAHAKAVAMAKAKTLEAFADAYYGTNAQFRQSSHHDSARYCAVNLHSWFYRKTIEFRMFNSSLNPERVQGYIGMCMAIVQDARNGFSRSVNKRYPLGGMSAGTTNVANARHRFLQVLRYDGGMALEDMERLTKCWKDSAAPTDALAMSAF